LLATLGSVLARIQQDVLERVTDLPRRSERTRVVAVVEQPARSHEVHVERTRQPYRQRPHPRDECSMPIGLDDRMDVIRHDGVVHDAERRVGSHRSHGANDDRPRPSLA